MPWHRKGKNIFWGFCPCWRISPPLRPQGAAPGYVLFGLSGRFPSKRFTMWCDYPQKTTEKAFVFPFSCPKSRWFSECYLLFSTVKHWGPSVEWHFTIVKWHLISKKCHFSSVKCHSTDDPQCHTVSRKRAHENCSNSKTGKGTTNGNDKAQVIAALRGIRLRLLFLCRASLLSQALRDPCCRLRV